MTTVSQQNLTELQELAPKRIYLPTANVLKKGDDNSRYYGALNFPFKETVQTIFEKDTGLNLFDNNSDIYNQTSVWYSIKNQDEFDKIEKWIDAQGTTVFIRSLLPSCIALDVNVDYANEVKTKIGDLEYKAKNNQNQDAIDDLVDLLCSKIQLNQEEYYLAAVPANKDKGFDLPTLLVAKIAEKLGCRDITDHFQYQNSKQALKSVGIGDKWQELERANLQFEQHILDNKPIILIDDKYQSGTTLHYVASKLNEAEFNTVYGLVIVKTIKEMITNKPIKIEQDNPLYPQNIANFFKKPLSLSVLGNINLLKNNAVGFCGSRKVSDKGISASHNCVNVLTHKHNNVVIVSGNANGVDLEVHYMALKQGANTILVLPEGINHFKIKRKLQAVWDWERALVISQFDDNANWQVWQAMTRNNLILSLSKAMVVVEAGEKGGTKAAADSAIKHNTPLFVIDYQHNPAGNELLKNQTAQLIRKNKNTGEANTANLESVVF
ncbi:MAG: hypothetical protein HFP77_00245 [Methylococcales symbiont of Iophon sp. n. MRB-2018]|nr:MAG: hypothetical protein HFP77_00245 [Methylococcales symbiont of Iophon sp. n. MRB-2018]KAF3980763.1 MAG: hypothetical protein HFP76_00425 [Methylococcales symbiont of Iophon sp. n. MRB-2018]